MAVVSRAGERSETKVSQKILNVDNILAWPPFAAASFVRRVASVAQVS